MSTVPPWQLREEGPANLRHADGVFPPTVTLYLKPVSADLALVNRKMKDQGFGDEILCFVYFNVNVNKFSPTVMEAIDLFRTNVFYTMFSESDALEHFAEGEFTVWVNGGVLLGEASESPPPFVGFSSEFGVLTSTGFVDPSAFFRALSVYFPNTQGLNEFVTLFPPTWPILGGTGTAVTGATVNRLYPWPVLYEAKRRLTASEWYVVGIFQKTLYWKRLLVSTATSQAGPSFVFNIDDSFNRFQVEVVIEFYLSWPEPAVPGGPKPLPTHPAMNQEKVNLSSGWHLVVIDPFDHPHLGNPALPAPDYVLKSYVFTGQCVEAKVPPPPIGNVKTLHPDLYRGVLFLFKEGEVKAYYRWSTYTAHRWEDPSQTKPEDEPDVSSAVGNVHYDFQSHVAPTVKNINYGFWIYKPGDPEKKTDGRSYFPDPIPTALDKTGKTAVMVHIGYSVDVENPKNSYNGSGGCIVSPSFPRLRRLVAELYLADPAAPKMLRPFLKSTHASCKAMWARSVDEPTLGNYIASVYDPKVYDSNEWEGTITGGCWIVRPDEPTTR
ncbi:MAG TPA: hypothetical protein VGS22_15845 [Thermoanaerobaculia bacterium]|nr:hypothetical protein [Thermoanaerobaculia bacterium]